MGCGSAIMRLILFIVNLLITLLAIALVAIGGACIYKLDELETIFEDNATFVGFGALTLGLLLLVLGITGVCGACVQGTNICIVMHLVMLGFLIIAEGCGIGLLFYYSGSDSLEDEISDTVGDAFSAYGGNGTSNTAITDGIDMFQETLECCGQNDYKDWSNGSIAFTWAVSLNQGAYLPDSCCMAFTADCGKSVDVEDATAVTASFYIEGCEDKVMDFLDEWSYNIAGILIAIFILQILCFLFSCCLACANKKEN
jgi:hypothetical protein